MDDIVREAANGFDIKLHSYSKSRAAFLLDADAGLFILKRQPDVRKIDILYGITEALHNAGFKNAERYLASNGKPYVFIKEEIYTVSTCGDGGRCSLSDLGSVLEVAKSIAHLHRAGIVINHDGVATSDAIFSYYYSKKIAEARHIKKWLGKQSRLTDIDVLFIKKYNEFLSRACDASEQICEAAQRDELCLCLGEIKEDNIYINSDNRIILMNFENSVLSAPVTDLCQLIRRFIKRGGSTSHIPQIIDAYSGERELSPRDIKLLKAYLSFPHKFFALANKYYNGKKTFGGSQTFIKLSADVSYQEKIFAALNSI